MTICRIDIFCTDGKKYTHLVSEYPIKNNIPTYSIYENTIRITNQYNETYYPFTNMIKYEIRFLDEKDPEYSSFCKTFNLTEELLSRRMITSTDLPF